MTLNICFNTICALSLGIGYCNCLIAIARDIRDNFNSINKRVIVAKNGTMITKDLSELIQFHTDAEQLSINPITMIQ